MKTVFDAADLEALLRRIEALPATAPRQWGKMDPAQMLAHCANTLEAATGDLKIERNLLAKILGPLFRKAIVGPKPFSRNSPTHPKFVMSDPRDFAKEKARLVAGIRKFVERGPAAAAAVEHGFIGRISGEDWGRLVHKHCDHHLQQFGG